MPRVSKKEAQRRRAVGLSLDTRAQKRQKLDLSAMEDNGWQSDAPSEGMLTEEEDQYPIGQPKAGWEEAERTVHGPWLLED
jgi:hypothetical protein